MPKVMMRQMKIKFQEEKLTMNKDVNFDNIVERYQELFNKRRAADEYYEKIVNKNEKQLTE